MKILPVYEKNVSFHQKKTSAVSLLRGCLLNLNEIVHLLLLTDVFYGDLIRFYGVPLPVIQKLVLTDPFVYL
ncbi:MAG: hypothetical protein MK434_10395 [SAR324 cluster bacterium]|nr:hypothetical protein [SAR324 cluster bacterium]